MINKVKIIEYKKKLLNAFSNSDMKVIDELLYDNALFVYPNGLTLTPKQWF